MHKVTYTMVAGVFFWLGAASGVGKERPAPFKRVTPPEQLTPALTPICENLTEIRRACHHRAQSSLIQKITPNTKGSM